MALESSKNLLRLETAVLNRSLRIIRKNPDLSKQELFPWKTVSQEMCRLYEAGHEDVHDLDQDRICELVIQFHQMQR